VPTTSAAIVYLLTALRANLTIPEILLQLLQFPQSSAFNNISVLQPI
jgi:hypothetical protein